MLAAEAASFLTLDTHFTQRATTNKTLGGSNSNHLKFGTCVPLLIVILGR